jgi:hypothetical protein
MLRTTKQKKCNIFFKSRRSRKCDGKNHNKKRKKQQKNQSIKPNEPEKKERMFEIFFLDREK